MTLPDTAGIPLKDRTAAIEISSGLVVGRKLSDGGSLYAGIPYAAPPIGALRFQPPEPVPSWTGIRMAGDFAPAPRQTGFGGPAIEPQSEDCLYLNVWAPGTPGPHPTLFFLYGGGFEIGSASPPYTDLERLSRSVDAVVVAPNYRLGVLGFLYLGGSWPEWRSRSNLGIRDQVAALKWVSHNIAALGGDPNNVTIMGTSAGAVSVGALMVAPSANMLFHRAIQSSGVLRLLTAERAEQLGGDFMAALGIGDPVTLTSMPVERLLNAQNSVLDPQIVDRLLPGSAMWGPVVDHEVLPDAPTDAFQRGDNRGIDLLQTAMTEEMKLWEVSLGEAYGPADETELRANLVKVGVADPEAEILAYRTAGFTDLPALKSALLTDALFRAPSIAAADAHVTAGGRAYTALFAVNPWGAERGSAHGADAPYMFDRIDRLARANGAAVTSGDLTIAAEVQDALRRFIRSGDPGWPAYDKNSAKNTRLFGGHGGMTRGQRQGFLRDVTSD